MFNITTKIHDKFSIEFKMGFSGSQQDRESNFMVNSWFFIPYSLNINAETYGKEQFYRDVRSNIRLITPSFPLADLANEHEMPLRNLRAVTDRLLATPNTFSMQEFDLQVKLYVAIFKSSLRDETLRIMNLAVDDTDIVKAAISDLVRILRAITQAYRSTGNRTVGKNTFAETIFRHGDEYISHLISIQSIKIHKNLLPDLYEEERELIQRLVHDELTYKERCHYSHTGHSDTPATRELIYRHSLLKKYISSVLYLKTDTTEDGAAMQELSLSLAAGLAMFISLLIALPFQKYLGNYPFLIFIILVVAYMFKDRIKEFARKKFVHRMKAKYFDHKCTIQFKDKNIGYIREGMDFINDSHIPPEVLRLRNRSALEEDNRLFLEKTILYRKHVQLETKTLSEQDDYQFSGINDIMRFHIQRYTLKMDDPVILLESLDENGKYSQFNSLRIYPIHIIMQFVSEGKCEYRGFLIQATRNGIVSCEEVK